MALRLGGPIVKNRVWFYVGFAPTSTLYRNERAVRRGVLDPMTGRARLLDGYRARATWPPACTVVEPAAPALATEELSVYGNNYDESKRLCNGIAKLQFNINADHNITIGYIAAPSTFDGYSAFTPFSYSNVSDFRYSSLSNTHDVNARYVGKLLDRKLQIDVMYGYHYQDYDQRPARPPTNRPPTCTTPMLPTRTRWPTSSRLASASARRKRLQSLPGGDLSSLRLWSLRPSALAAASSAGGGDGLSKFLGLARGQGRL